MGADILAILFIFGVIPVGLPVALRWLKYRHEAKMKALQAGGDGKQVLALQAAKTELEERVRNLESIVCSVDFELNAKLNRLATRQIALQAARPAAVDDSAFADTEHFVGGTVQAGKKLAGRFVVERTLGQGGMGAVYLAHDEKLGEKVALKIVAGMAVLDPSAADRLRREATAARRISHVNVVRLHDLGEHEGLLFLSMEYVAGPSLRDLIARHGVLPLDKLREVVRQLADGLEAAHAVGVIHRDLKPANLLFDDHGRLKIIDFGLARLPHLEGMTATNMIVGTVEYMAPEQIRGGAIDSRTDLYAVGCVVYHALTGRPPFAGDTPIAVGLAHCADPVVPPSKLRDGLDVAWDGFVAHALAKSPTERFQSAAELRDALPK